MLSHWWVFAGILFIFILVMILTAYSKGNGSNGDDT